MAIDIRADVTCNLGTLISASINDDYVQGAGLIKTSGSCEIAGIVTPKVGDIVTFEYTKGGITRRIPRKLRVLSSFANPFRRTTSISLGCKLTYLQDLTDPINWDALDDPENASRTETEQEIVTIPIYAKSIMNKCLTELGITATSNPLTNVFSIPSFDFSSGYVNILNDLLISESYCGFLGFAEVLQVFSLDQEGGTGPVLTKNEIIDIGPINVGQLPGEAVTVSYNTLKLKQPEGGEPSSSGLAIGGGSYGGFERTFSSSTGKVGISYTNPTTNAQSIAVYNTFQSSETITSYKELLLRGGEKRKVVDSRITIEKESGISLMGSIASTYLSNGLSFGNYELRKETNETYTYDSAGNETIRDKLTRGSAEYIIAKASVPWVFSPTDIVAIPSFSTDADLSREIVYSQTVGSSSGTGSVTSSSIGSGNGFASRTTSPIIDSTLTYTLNYGPWIDTIGGQQAIAEGRDSFTSAAEVESFLSTIVGGLNLLNTITEINQSSSTQIAPDEADINNSNNADESGDPNNGYRTESKSELELALGSSTAQRRIELSMPNASDDVFIKNPGTPVTYSAKQSDATQKAQKYGRVQNKLLLGGRNGMNLQVSPEKLPSAPFSAFTVQAGGLSGLYRTNGTAWTVDPTGVVVSTDALFWGAVGGTGDFWFPVAPGITTLPSTPATEDTSPEAIIGTIATVGSSPQNTLNTAFPGATSGDGVQDQSNDNFWVYNGTQWENAGATPGPTIVDPIIVPVWNETVIATANVRATLTIQSFNYPLEILTQVPQIIVRTKFEAVKIRKVLVPGISININTFAPVISIGFSAKPGTVNLVTTGLPPLTSTGASIDVPFIQTSINQFEPVIVTGLSILIPVVNIEYNALAPIAIGPPPVLIEVPAIDINFTVISPNITVGFAVFIPAIAVNIQAQDIIIEISSQYYGSWANQNYGSELDFYPDWWAN